jgi:8-oxo-dGTP diphosphatase
MMPADDYIASLARKTMAAGALFLDGAGRVLLVDPVYRDTWLLPGGGVEADESPRAACRREVAEEIGLDRPPGRLLAVDWVAARPDFPEILLMIYEGGVLTAAEIAAITVPAEELAGFELVPPALVAKRVAPVAGRRIAACLEALRTGTVASLENGRAVG